MKAPSPFTIALSIVLLIFAILWIWSEREIQRMQKPSPIGTNRTVTVPSPVGVRQMTVVYPTNRVRCTTNCPVASIGVEWVWQHQGDPQKTHYRFYSGDVLLGTNSQPRWRQYFSNAPMQLITCVAVDEDMPRMSDGRLK